MPLSSQTGTSWTEEDSKVASGDLNISLSEIVEVLSPSEQKIVMEILEICETTSVQGSTFVGLQAAQYANRLAALRTNVSMYAQYYKTSAKSDTQRKRKDLLHAIFQSVEENINTLKLLARETSSMGMR